MTDSAQSSEGTSIDEDRTNSPPKPDRLPVLAVTLLKGPIFRARKPDLWGQLDLLQAQVRDHMAVLGLDLEIDEAEGYAFLRSAAVDESNPSGIPRLLARRPLTFEVSLLLALLRKRLAEFDGADGGETRLIMSKDEIVEMMRLFGPDSTNEAKLHDQIERHLNKAIDLGFVRRLDKRATADRSVRYEVLRIIKAFVDGQWLAELDEQLAEYRQRLTADNTSIGDDASIREPDAVTAAGFNGTHGDQSDHDGAGSSNDTGRTDA